MGSNLNQKLKHLVRPASVKIQVFQNTLNSICKTMWTTYGQNFSSMSGSLLKLLPQNPPENDPNWVLNQKRQLFILSKIENNKQPDAGPWHLESIDRLSY